jgi:hypothetical protein
MSATKGLPNSLQLKLLRAIVEFMIRSGLNNAAIRDAFSSCLGELEMTRTAKRNTVSREGRYVGNGNVSAELIRLWTRDGRYIDRDARPKPLSLANGRNSLVALIARLDPSADPHSAVESMRSVGLLQKLPNGKYIPTAESVTIDRLHPLAIEHVAKSLIRLVTTVCRNTDPLRQSIPLIERYAYVPDLSKSEANAFAEFTRVQGMAYLESVDDWLEQRRVRRLSAKVSQSSKVAVTAGVHLVAYLGDGAANLLAPRTSRTAKAQRSPARATRALGSSQR